MLSQVGKWELLKEDNTVGVFYDNIAVLYDILSC